MYNTLSKLAEAGKIQELDIDPHKKRFDPYTVLDCHFYCTACGRVFDVACDAPLPGYLAEGRTVEGHRVDAVHSISKGYVRTVREKDKLLTLTIKGQGGGNDDVSGSGYDIIGYSVWKDSARPF